MIWLSVRLQTLIQVCFIVKQHEVLIKVALLEASKHPVLVYSLPREKVGALLLM